MKLIIKTLQGKQLPIEVEETQTIKEVKEVIEKEHSMQADLLKLIAYGKVMDNDAKTIKDHTLKDGDFIVCMVTKAKPAPKQQPKPEDAKQEEVQQPASTTTTTTTNQETTQQQQPTATTNQTNVQQPESSSSNQALTAEQESAVSGLVESTGRSREDCVKALQFTKEPNSAFELLLSTEGQPIDQVIQALQQHAALGGGGDGMEDDGGDYNEGDEGGFDHDLGAGGLQALQQLAQNPNFALIRQRIIQDPSFYNQFLQSLQTQQPELFQVIQQNPAAFMNLIMGGNVNAGLGVGGGQGGQPGGMGGMNPGQQQQQQNAPGTVRVSQEEMEAIERLASLGFPKARAAEAYFACDKNEEFAANFLFEAGQEDEDTATQNAIIASQQNTNQQPQQNQQNQEQQQQDQQQQNNNNNDNNNNNGGNEGGNNDGDNNGGDGGDGGSSLI